MLSHTGMLTSLSSSIVLALVLLLTADPASAQTTPALSEATPTAGTIAAASPPAAAVSDSTSTPAASSSSEASPATVPASTTAVPTTTAAHTRAGSTTPASTLAVSPAVTSPTASPSPAAQVGPIQCKRNINASVVAFSQPYMLNRLGAAMPNAQIFALENDVDMKQLQLKGYKRARPIVLRANVGDC